MNVCCPTRQSTRALPDEVAQRRLLLRYGQKYEVSVTLQAPNGQARGITTVWLVPVSDNRPKFITAFPG